MNKERRKEISRAVAMIDEAKGILESCKDEEQDYYDNMPESLQGGDKGTSAENSVSVLEDAVSSLDETISNIENME